LSGKRGSDAGQQQRECEAKIHCSTSFNSRASSSAANAVREGGIHCCDADPSCR
jgi:hypothetical protein